MVNNVIPPSLEHEMRNIHFQRKGKLDPLPFAKLYVGKGVMQHSELEHPESPSILLGLKIERTQGMWHHVVIVGVKDYVVSPGCNY